VRSGCVQVEKTKIALPMPLKSIDYMSDGTVYTAVEFEKGLDLSQTIEAALKFLEKSGRMMLTNEGAAGIRKNCGLNKVFGSSVFKKPEDFAFVYGPELGSLIDPALSDKYPLVPILARNERGTECVIRFVPRDQASVLASPIMILTKDARQTLAGR